MPTPFQIDPQTGERIAAPSAPQIDPMTGERISASPPPAAPQTAWQRLLGDHPLMGPIQTAIDHITSAAKSLPELVEPQNTAEAIAGPASVAYKMLVRPSVSSILQARAQSAAGNRGLNTADPYDAQGNYQPTGLSSLEDAIPIAGPWARSIENDAHKRGALSALTGMATDVGLGEATGGVLRKIAGPPIVAGQNYTAPQLAAHTGILGRMNGLGDNFIPQDAAASTGSVIRQAAADNPAIATAATKGGSTTSNIAAFQNILQKANSALEAPHAATLAKFASTPADVSGVQAAVKSALPQSLAGVAPEDAAALQEMSQRLGTVKDLGGLNDLRQWLNNEASAGYKQDGVAAARGTATKAGIRSAADVARNAYYDQMQQASGVDFQPIKSQQSALLSQMEGAAKLGQNLSAQQAIADEPKNLAARAAEVVTGGRALKAGPVAGAGQLIAEKVFGQKPLTQPNYLIRKFLSDLPDPTPAAAVPPPVGPIVPPAQLPSGPVPSPQLPAPQGIVPSPQPIPAPASSTYPNPVALPGGNQLQLPQGAPQTTSTTLPGNPEIAAPTQAPQLSAGDLIKMLTDSASRTNVRTAYPPLNADTAAMRVAPARFTPVAQVPAKGPMVVNPQGEVVNPSQPKLGAGPLAKAVKAAKKVKQ